MQTLKSRAVAALCVTLGLMGQTGWAQEAPASPAPSPAAATTTDAADSAALTLGGEVVLRLHGGVGGYTAQQRIDVILGRLTPILGVPNIQPGDVVVYTPSAQSKGNRAPVVYALGHRLITVDPATAKDAGGGTPRAMAVKLAKHLQQLLPRINWRPSNAPEPNVPANPPLLVTSDFAKVGGAIGTVVLRGKPVIRLRGPQPIGFTPAERADIISARLDRIAPKLESASTDAVTVVEVPASATTPAKSSAAPAAGSANAAQLVLAGTPLLTVEPTEARAAGAASSAALAQSWAKNIRAALGLPPASTVTPPIPAAKAAPLAPSAS